ncbi:DUF6528 family protein [Streptomyces sp. NPDC002248]
MRRRRGTSPTLGRRALLLGALGAGVTVALPFTRRGYAASPPGLLVCDQLARQVLLLDSTRADWNPVSDPAVVSWRFAPDTDARYADLKPAESFTHLSEAKPVVLDGREHVLVSASCGFAALVEYPSGDRRWAARVTDGGKPDDLNPHSLEILPSGNIAVACSASGEVRLYAASQSPTSTDFTTVPLPGAHGVQWHAASGLLWALGDTELVAFRPTGAPGQERLTREKGTRIRVDLAGTPSGHDLYAVSGQPDLMWVSTGSSVFQYSLSADAFQTFSGASSCAAQPGGVKSISNVGLSVAMTAPDGNLDKSWWTKSVRVEGGDPLTHTLTGSGYGGVYKARWWQPQER